VPVVSLREVSPQQLVVGIDVGKAQHRVLLASGERGVIGQARSVSALRDGVEELVGLIAASGCQGLPLIGIEASGALHAAWSRELERRYPGRVLLFAPSETTAARTQMGARRFKSDDADCAALVWLVRQGSGRPPADGALDALLAAVRHRRALVDARRRLRHHLHAQLHGLCPGLSAPRGQGRSLDLETPTGQAVLACAVALAGHAPTCRSLTARAGGRLTAATASYWVERWQRLLAPPVDAELRARRLEQDLRRFALLRTTISEHEAELQRLLAPTAGVVLTSLPGVGVVRAAAFAAHSLPIERFPSAERLYAATGLAPARYQSVARDRRQPISRQGLGDHRDALMSIAWGLSQYAPAFRERHAELVARGMRPIEARVALARHACRLCHALLRRQEPYDDQRYRQQRHRRGR
jgi:transposase